MEATAITKNVRISASKARQVTRIIQGMDYKSALGLVTFANKKSSCFS